MQSPHTADAFLDDLLTKSSQLKGTVNDSAQFASYIVSSWKGILKSRGIFI